MQNYSLAKDLETCCRQIMRHFQRKHRQVPALVIIAASEDGKRITWRSNVQDPESAIQLLKIAYSESASGDAEPVHNPLH